MMEVNSFHLKEKKGWHTCKHFINEGKHVFHSLFLGDAPQDIQENSDIRWPILKEQSFKDLCVILLYKTS